MLVPIGLSYQLDRGYKDGNINIPKNTVPEENSEQTKTITINVPRGQSLHLFYTPDYYITNIDVEYKIWING